MAYWQRKTVKGRTYVYVYSSVSGTQKALPRSETKHLDSEPDHNIEAWVRQWAEQYEGKKVQSENINWSNSTINQYLDKYELHLKSLGRSHTTIQQHLSALRRFVVPYYLGIPLPECSQWHHKSNGLMKYLTELEVTPPVINVCNFSLRGFWRFLIEEMLVPNEQLILRRPQGIRSEVTPLKFTLMPSDVLSHIRNTNNTEVKLLALLGYFLTLRPQELFSIRKSDFRVSNQSVIPLECVRVFQRAGLYHKLVAHIQRQRNSSGKLDKPKNGSVGWVACFDRDAAQLIVKLFKEIETDEIFQFGNQHYYDLWADAGIPDITLKDLRRASTYYLTHHSSILPVELLHHTRHKSIDSLKQYWRRPEEELDDVLDLEA